MFNLVKDEFDKNSYDILEFVNKMLENKEKTEEPENKEDKEDK